MKQHSSFEPIKALSHVTTYNLTIYLFYLNSPQSSVQGTNVGILSVAEYVYSNYVFCK